MDVADPGVADTDPSENSMPTVTLGVDAHKRSHTVVGVDAVGKKLGEKTVPSTSIGHAAALN